MKAFQYFSAADPDREAVIQDDDRTEDNDASQSDLVRICLNLAFINKETLRKTIGFNGLLKNGLANIKTSNVIAVKREDAKEAATRNSIN